MQNPLHHLLLLCCMLLAAGPGELSAATAATSPLATTLIDQLEQQLRATAEKNLQHRQEQRQQQLLHLNQQQLLSAADYALQLGQLNQSFGAQRTKIAELSRQLSALQLSDARPEALRAVWLLLQGDIAGAEQQLQGDALAGGSQQRLQRLLQTTAADQLSAADRSWLQQMAFEYNQLLVCALYKDMPAAAVLPLGAQQLLIDQLFSKLYPTEINYQRLLGQSLLQYARLNLQQGNTAQGRQLLLQGLALWKDISVQEGGSRGSQQWLTDNYLLLLSLPAKKRTLALYRNEFLQLPLTGPLAEAYRLAAAAEATTDAAIDCSKLDEHFAKYEMTACNQMMSLYLMQDKLDVVTLINEVMRFSKLRSEMSNPISYPQFDSVYRKMNTAIPDKDRLSKKQLEDSQLRLKEVLNTPLSKEIGSQLTSGAQLTRVFTGVLHVLTGVNIETVVLGIKNVISNTYNYQGLQALKSGEIERRQQEAITMHQRLDTLLSVYRNELQDFTLEIQLSAAISERILALREKLLDSRHRLASQIAFEEPADIREIITGTDFARTRELANDIQQSFRQSRPPCQAADLTDVIVNCSNFTAVMNNLQADIQLVNTEYNALINHFVSHYQEMEQNLSKRPNPFNAERDKSAHDTYERMRTDALQSLKEINRLIVEIFGQRRA